ASTNVSERSALAARSSGRRQPPEASPSEPRLPAERRSYPAYEGCPMLSDRNALRASTLIASAPGRARASHEGEFICHCHGFDAVLGGPRRNSALQDPPDRKS